MADTYLSRTPSSAGNQKTMTFSFWIKRSDVENEFSFLYSAGQDANNRDGIRFYNNSLDLIIQRNDYDYYRLLTTAKFRDVSAWYHIVIAIDTTDSTSSNRFKMYVNGSQITDFQTETYPPQNLDLYFNDNSVQYIGRFYSSNSSHFDGYMAETHFTDGTAYAPTTFGQTNTDGIWTPAVGPSVTYGTNGFYLKFENSGAMGTDSSGNSNTFSVGGGTVRQVPDSPTNVFATLNPLTSGAEAGFSDGNLRFFADTTQTYPFGVSTLGFSSGKWYCEFLREANAVTGGVGIFVTELDANSDPSTRYTYERTGQKNNNGSYSAYGDSWGVGDVIGIAYDGSTGDVVYYKNGVSQGTAYTIPTSTVYTFGCQSYTENTQIDVANFGQDSTFAGNKTAGSNSDANGLGNFLYTVPTGHLALCTDNLSSTLTIPINKGDSYFNTLTWSGDNTTRNLTGVGFSPDWVWIKSRSDSAGHVSFDTVRGASVRNVPNSSAGDTTTNEYGFVTAFGSDGFTLTPGNQGAYASGDTNMTGRTYVGWNWRGSDSSAVSNTDGSITSTVSANTTAGFSIVTYTGTGANATVGHGLGKAPNLVIVKLRSGTGSWAVYSRAVGATKVAYLESTTAFFVNSSFWNNTDPTSSVFSLGSEATTNTNGGTLVAYCFADIEGYSKIGTYTGNGTGSFGPFPNGPFIYTGFKPAWVMIKRTDGANGWNIFDTARNPTNIVEKQLFANSSAAEEGDASHHAERDYYSNGFKLKGNGNDINANGANYLYMAFAENPLVSSGGTPVTAR